MGLFVFPVGLYRLNLLCEKDFLAIYKILATLGVIAEKTLVAQDSDSSGREFTAQMDLLLPLEEYWQDRKELKAQILGAISDFSFRGRSLFGQLERIEMQPEEPTAPPRGQDLWNT